MIVEVSMNTDEAKFRVDRWWATTPAFVIDALTRQLNAAAAIWPELESVKISMPKRPLPPPDKDNIKGGRPLPTPARGSDE